MTISAPGRPEPSEYSPYFQRYIDRAADEADVVAAMAAQTNELQALLGSLSEEQAGRRYAEGKWSVRELLGHVADAERVFAYRIMCIARGETQSLAGFDEKVYAAASGAHGRTLPDLLGEFSEQRAANVRLLRSLTPEAWMRPGVADGNPVTPRATVYVMLGHVRHHMAVLRERYLQAT